MGAGLTLWPLLVAMFVASVAVAVLPLRPTGVRLSVLASHVVASCLLIAFLGEPWQMWFLVLGLGAFIAAARFVFAIRQLTTGRQRSATR
ncbi:hypothetical protein [Saccharothrix obliqua]|uniref:hypothetical protein n=1 Tax=Saccharothrix obliqua TaxID=2861747 RepID=UPI001C6046AA|nr:hypothetical protein [Saccharothrix obliqua]MBW4721338.1 hypothetical protein [Saccharothrix obliqua]